MTGPNRLLGDIWIVSGAEISHPWDASAYLIPGDEPTLIDCGTSEGYPHLKRALKEIGYDPRDIVRVIGTHGHWDHLSGMAALRAESDAQLWLHEADRAQIESGDPDMTAAFLYDRPFPTVQVDELLGDGQVLAINGHTLTVHHTPGHTRGSVCLTTEAGGQRLLISGDTVWGGFSPRVRSDMEAWRASLQRLVTLDFDVMTMGHYNRLIPDAHQKVERAVAGFGLYFNPWFDLDGRGF